MGAGHTLGGVAVGVAVGTPRVAVVGAGAGRLQVRKMLGAGVAVGAVEKKGEHLGQTLWRHRQPGWQVR